MKGRFQYQLSLTASGAYIHKSHRTVKKKKQFLTDIAACSHSYRSTPSTKRAGKNIHFPISPWKGLNHIFSQLLLEGLASNQTAPRCLLIYPSGTLTGLGTSLTSVSHWGKGRQFGQLQWFEKQPRAQDRLMKFISFTRLFIKTSRGYCII